MSPTAASPITKTSVIRIEVRPAPGLQDPFAENLARDSAALGIPLAGARTANIYLIQASLTEEHIERIRAGLLTDPVSEVSNLGAENPLPDTQIVEVHPLPGVMDPVAQSVSAAIRELTGLDARVSTGRRYDLEGVTSEQADTLATRLLANPVIHGIHRAPWTPDDFPAARPHEHAVRTVPLRDLTDEQLQRLSRDAHLFLSLDEMRAIRDQYRRLDREPTDIELETLAQTWSEHCVHKTLKSDIRYTPSPNTPPDDPLDFSSRPGHEPQPDGSTLIRNLLKSTVAAATHELIADGLDWALSVFVDNAGVIAFDDDNAVCVKVETHNHPSAIEPYGGAATGIGGCIRDIMGTGLAARPIAGTDVFCVASPDRFDASNPPPPGCLHPRRVLSQVVAGVRDYGNRMGIPTVNGAVYFDDRYIGNPLVFCGCIGVMPRDRIKGEPRRGDLIVALGGRTGRDGIHGATFSSAELTDTHADEFAHAVQIGNPIEQKRLLDAIIRARDEHHQPLFTAITDCGAGGFSSAVGEMGETLGATVHLERAPLKYDGLSYTEIWISEAQERMVLAVPPDNLETLRAICDQESVELAVLGHFGTPPESPEPLLILNYRGSEVGRLPMNFLHNGIPTPRREAVWPPVTVTQRSAPQQEPNPLSGRSLADLLLELLAHPNIASKHWIIRQYDHEVQAGTLIKPLVGPRGRGPADAAVLSPVPGSDRALAVACGLQPGIADPAIGGDPYLSALAAVDECVRNLVCVGADPARTAILDNFCWPSCAKPENLGALVRAAEGCYDAAKAYRTPFISGKDSLNNQFTVTDPATGRARTIEIPYTLLITGVGTVHNRARCLTMDAKRPGNILLLVGRTTDALAGSCLHELADRKVIPAFSTPPRADLETSPRTAAAVYAAIRDGLVASAHDCSDGGLLVAAAEMLIAGASATSPIGAELDLSQVHKNPIAAAFAETPARYLLEIEPDHLPRVKECLANTPHAAVGTLTDSGELSAPDQNLRADTADLIRAWRATLDW